MNSRERCDIETDEALPGPSGFGGGEGKNRAKSPGRDCKGGKGVEYRKSNDGICRQFKTEGKYTRLGCTYSHEIAAPFDANNNNHVGTVARLQGAISSD